MCSLCIFHICDIYSIYMYIYNISLQLLSQKINVSFFLKTEVEFIYNVVLVSFFFFFFFITGGRQSPSPSPGEQSDSRAWCPPLVPRASRAARPSRRPPPVVLVSSVQQSDSVIHTYIYIYTYIYSLSDSFSLKLLYFFLLPL